MHNDLGILYKQNIYLLLGLAVRFMPYPFCIYAIDNSYSVFFITTKVC